MDVLNGLEREKTPSLKRPWMVRRKSRASFWIFLGGSLVPMGCPERTAGECADVGQSRDSVIRRVSKIATENVHCLRQSLKARHRYCRLVLKKSNLWIYRSSTTKECSLQLSILRTSQRQDHSFPFLILRARVLRTRLLRRKSPLRYLIAENIVVNSWSGQLHSAVAIDIELFKYIHKRIEVAFQFVNKYRLVWSSPTYEQQKPGVRNPGLDWTAAINLPAAVPKHFFSFFFFFLALLKLLNHFNTKIGFIKQVNW